VSGSAYGAETPADRATRGRARLRRALLAARRCPCDPTRGDSCRYCDGTAADGSDRMVAHVVAAATTQLDHDERQMLAEAAGLGVHTRQMEPTR
jgi:hypothetical protein